MSDLTTNKILAAVLAVALVIVGLNAVIPELFREDPADQGRLRDRGVAPKPRAAGPRRPTFRPTGERC